MQIFTRGTFLAMYRSDYVDIGILNVSYCEFGGILSWT